MDWEALRLSLKLATVTLIVLLPAGIIVGRWLAYSSFRGKAWIESLIILPLVLPPTVLGYYLLVSVGGASPLGRWFAEVFNIQLAFNFLGLLLASLVFNVPFLVQPVQRAFETIPREYREAAAVSGLSAWRAFWKVELPLAWPGVFSAMVLTFVHTLGEFGVVLMIGGSIPGETKTIAISIYDRVQGFDLDGANRMASLLLVLSLCAVAASFFAAARFSARR